jgi:glutamyl-Q tRNA(Asp) synthetase
MSVITRFAPSPTGDLHLGHILAAKVARDLAKASRGGIFLLRHEDIDGGRVKEECYERIEADLLWLGLDWDGNALRQSSRTDAYASALRQIRDLGLAYPCFCTRKDIQAETTRILAAPHGNEAMVYPGICRNLDPKTAEQRIASGEPHSWRLDSAKAAQIHGSLTFHDLRFGTTTVNAMVNGDVVLARKDIGTSYHLAVVVDDAFQGITHVTRGEDLLGATHVQRQLQAILGYPEPLYLHHALVRDENGIRLAKRDAARSIRQLREDGFSAPEILKMAEAAINASHP